MKVFLKKTILFTVILVLISILFIVYSPYDKKYGYGFAPGSYSHLRWIHGRIFVNSDEVDIAFVGSSRTLSGVIDSLIETRLSTNLGENINVANLAINHMGRNLQSILVGDLLSIKKTDLIFIEVRERESTHGHIAFPFIAEGKDIVCPRSILNLNLIQDYAYAIRSRLSYSSEALFPTLEGQNQVIDTRSSFGFQENTEKITYEELERRKIKYEKDHQILDKPLVRNMAFELNRNYLKHIAETIINDKKLVFLYLPQYNTRFKTPSDIDYYRNFGEVWLPPDSIIANPDNFANLTHFNRDGATQISEWLSEKIVDYYSK